MKKNVIGIADAVLLDNKLWFVLSDYKNLISMDIKTKVTKSYLIPGAGTYVQYMSYASMALVGNKIYLIPMYARMLFQFDIESEKFTEVKLDSEVIENQSMLFMGVGLYKQYLFVMGMFSPVILRINTIDNHVDYINDWQQDVRNLIFDSKDAYFRKQSVVIGDRLFVPFCNANAVLEIDCKSMSTVVHRMGEEKQGYSGICFDGKSLWFSPRKNGNMKKWDLDKNQVDTIQIFGLKELENTLTYGGVISHNNEILLLPTAKRTLLTAEAESVTELDGAFGFVQDNEKNIIIFERNSGFFTVFDKVANLQINVEITEIELDVERILLENHNLISENVIIDIKRFVDFFVQKE